MKVRLYYVLSAEVTDSIDVEAETIEEIREIAFEKYTELGAVDAWSEVLED